MNKISKRAMKSVIEKNNYNKYKVSKKEDRTYNGIVFDSKKEMCRYKELLLLEKAGKIKWLKSQEVFILLDDYKINNKKVKGIKYKSDFSYIDIKKNKMIIEDVKGILTPEFKLKKKLFESKFGVEITII